MDKAGQIRRIEDIEEEVAPQPAPVFSHYRGVADPSFAPNGKPYVVPEYLRNQCYIDEGYGRFSSCSIRN